MNNEPPPEENLTRICLNHNTNQHKLNVLVRNGSGTINTTKKPILQKKQSISNDLVTAEYPATSSAKGKPLLFPIHNMNSQTLKSNYSPISVLLVG